MGFGRQHGGQGRTVRTDPGYVSARPEQESVSLALGLALTVLVVTAVVDLVSAALTGWALTMDPSGFAAAPAELDVSPAATSMVATALEIGFWSDLAVVLSVLAGAVAVIRWQTRALRNLWSLGVERPRRSVRWAGLVWFVPGWGLFAPKQTFDELWRSGDRGLRLPPRGRGSTARLPGILAGWWTLWVGANLVDGVLACAVGASPRTGQVLVQQLVSVLVSGALIGAGVLLRRVVDGITGRQDARHAALVVPSSTR